MAHAPQVSQQMYAYKIKTDSGLGVLWMWVGMEIQIINCSKHIVYVTLHNPHTAMAAVDAGCKTAYTITDNNTQVNLSYYTKDHDMKNVCIKADGSWTISTTKMISPSCHSNDREMGGICRRRKTSN